jgi:phosphoglycerol transferase
MVKEKVGALADKVRNKYKSDIACVACMILFYILFIHVEYAAVSAVSKPWSYSGDGMGLYAVIANMADSGSTVENSRLAAPFKGEFYDFPAGSLTDNFCNLILKILYSISGGMPFAINMGFLCNGFLILCLSYVVTRLLNVNSLIAALAALTYTLSPYFFHRGLGHYYLGAYQFVPLSVLLCVWLYTDDNFFVINKRFFNRKNIAALVCVVLIAENGNGYYPVYACFFLLAAGLIKSGFRINKDLSRALAVIGCIALLFFVNLSPLFIYSVKNGASQEFAVRPWPDGEVYGLKIIQLFLPMNAHGIGKLAGKIALYNSTAPLVNENSAAYLGPLGSIGCLHLLVLLFIHTDNRRLFLLSRLNVAGVLLATVGGFMSIVFYFATQMLRGHNRISVFIAFFAILSTAILADDYINKKEKEIKRAVSFISIVIAIGGIFWQYPFDLRKKPVYDVSPVELSWNSDAAFISRIENEMPRGAMIYQMPFHRYPEGGPRNNMGDYQLFTGVVHSRHLKWSYGAMKGRYPDYWHTVVNGLPLEERLNVLSMVGFEGIYIDKRAYTPAENAELERKLSDLLQVSATCSEDNNLAFFSMAAYNQLNRALYSESELERMRGAIMGDIDAAVFISKNELSLSLFSSQFEQPYEYFISDGRAGWLMYGPYRRFKKGDYTFEIQYELMGSSSEGQIADVDICVNSGRDILAKMSVNASDFKDSTLNLNIPLTFERDAGDIEIRTFVHEGTILKIKRVRILD